MLVDSEQVWLYKKSSGMKQNTDDEEGLEPQTNSLDFNERKCARRLRFQSCLQKAEQQQHSDANQDLVDMSNRTLLEKQLESSEGQLEKLLLEGKESVTNVHIGSDAREVKRRKDEVSAREKRRKRLEDQANESAEKFNEVNSRWKFILESHDPLDLYHDIEEQKVKCAELITQKDIMIKELRKELKLADERFDTDQKKQKEDLRILAERVDNQIKVMRNAYKDELKLTEEVIELEHKQLMEVNDKNWEALYKKREKLEVEHIQKKFQAVDNYEDEIYRITVEHHEKFREVKIKLEADIQLLQQELELVKMQCLMNSEKLIYNYQVLKKREEENLIVQAQQKRSINRLQDVINNLKKEILETEKSIKTESARLTEEVIRLQHNIMNIDNKADNFVEMNDRKYQQVWELNRDTAKKLLDKILDIDRILHEQQLGVEWASPDMSFLQHEDLASYQSALQIVANIFTSEDAQFKNSISQSVACPAMTEEVEKLNARDMSLPNLLKLVAENSDFLAEQQLKQLLGQHIEKEKMLIQMDRVFIVLGLQNESEILMLKKCFLPYAQCSVCTTPQEKKVTTILKDSHEFDSTSSAGDTETAEAGLVLTTDIKSSVDAAEEEQQLKDKDITASETNSTPVRPFVDVKGKLHGKPTCSDMHPLLIDPTHVLKGLQDFVVKFAPEKYRPHRNLMSSLSMKHSTVSRIISTEDVTTFWKRFHEIFSPQQEKLWDSLLTGLQRYHRVLEDRHTLNVETEKLRQQNTELRRLLHFCTEIHKNESTFLSSQERLPPISGNCLQRTGKIKFAKTTTNSGKKSTY